MEIVSAIKKGDFAQCKKIPAEKLLPYIMLIVLKHAQHFQLATTAAALLFL